MSDNATPTLTADQEMEAAFRSGIEESLPEIQVEAAPEVPASTQTTPEGEKPAPTPSPSEWKPREFTFKRNGEEVRYTPSNVDEEVELLRKGYDYTQKTMAVAEERKQLQAIAKELHQRELERQAGIKAFLEDDAKLERYLQLRRGSTPSSGSAPPAPNGDDDLEPLTKAEFARLRDALLREVEEKSAQSAKVVHEEREVARLEADYTVDFNRTLSNLITNQFPILQDVEGVEQLIRADGHKAFKAHAALDPNNPVDPKVIKDAMAESAARRATRLMQSQRLAEKKEAVKAALVTKGAEPSGGNAPPAPQSKRYKLNDPDLDASIIAEIQSMMK